MHITSDKTLKVAVLGTGIMGAAMARNIQGAGMQVSAWNRTRSRAETLLTAGVVVHDRAPDAVSGADVVITALFDEASVADAIESATPGLAPNAIWIQVSTVSPESTGRFAAYAAEHDLRFLDSPVSGTRQPAEEGTLVLLVAGHQDHVEAAKPVLGAIGRKTVAMGRVGDASRLKLVLNGWVLALAAGAAESLALASAQGIDPALFIRAVEGGPLDSPFFQSKAAMLIHEDQTTAFSIRNARKDGRLIINAGVSAGIATRVTAAATDYLDAASERGLDDADISAMLSEARPSTA